MRFCKFATIDRKPCSNLKTIVLTKNPTSPIPKLLALFPNKTIYSKTASCLKIAKTKKRTKRFEISLWHFLPDHNESVSTTSGVIWAGTFRPEKTADFVCFGLRLLFLPAKVTYWLMMMES